MSIVRHISSVDEASPPADVYDRVMPVADHHYDAHLTWEGNSGPGTASYQAYERTFRATVPGKPSLAGSADPAFRGDGRLLNPEDLFLTAVAACHMLTYLALCARRGIVVVAYDDAASGTMRVEASGGRFTEIVLSPKVRLACRDRAEAALMLHEVAHRDCFLASSCSVPIRLHPEVVS